MFSSSHGCFLLLVFLGLLSSSDAFFVAHHQSRDTTAGMTKSSISSQQWRGPPSQVDSVNTSVDEESKVSFLINNKKNSIDDMAKATREAIQREVKLTYGVVQSDLPVTLVLGTVSTIAFAVARETALSPFEWVAMLVEAAVWFLAYGYQFNIENQIHGVEEDRLNSKELSFKANRPLVTGEMTMEEGETRQAISRAIYIVMSWLLGGPDLTLCALLWIVTSFFHNKRGWDQHFITKNWLSMSTGSISMLLAARNLAGETDASMIPPVLAAIWIGFCMDSQDLRDVVGDGMAQRQTTAVLWGVENARKVYVATATFATGSLLFLVQDCISWWPDAMIVAGILAHLARTLANETMQDDERTYKEICLAGFAFFCRSAFWAHTF